MAPARAFSRFLGVHLLRAASPVPLPRSFLRCCSSRFLSSGPPTTRKEDAEEEVVLSIDRSGLVPREENSCLQLGRVEQSAMSKHISALIKFRGGPISVAEYMGEVLTNSSAGFYMRGDVFGTRGDFVTSPDISQMFGEMIGVWSMLLWEQMGKPEHLALVELGPGRGALMADLIRGTAKFRDFAQALSIHLVECSPLLRKEQEMVLQYPATAESHGHDLSQPSGLPVSWYTDLEEVPRGVPCIIIAHEFYDALPIHQFQKTARGWCEKLVDITESHQDFRFVLSPRPTTTSTLYLQKRLQWATDEEKLKLEHVEVCPQAWKLSTNIARRIAEDGGGALVIDYGEDRVVTDSLQAIKKHRFGNVLEDPGSADLSAYVDFAAIKHAVGELAGGASVYGPVTQSQFLGSLGINFRLETLLNVAVSEEQKEALQLGYWVLVGDGPAPWLEDENERMALGMGARYKAIAIVQSKLGAPVGFL